MKPIDWLRRARRLAREGEAEIAAVRVDRERIDGLAADNAALRQEIAELKAGLAALKSRFEQSERFAIGLGWHALDRVDALTAPARLACLACDHRGEPESFGRREDECIFGGGRLIRHECPRCGCVFGPLKYLNLPATLIDADYTQLYAGYAEADSTEGEIRTFRSLAPRPGGRYLNWGCGAWSGAIERLRAEGYDVWGYEPNADNAHPNVLRRRDEIEPGFDGIFSHNVIEHLLDPAAQFRDFAALLKPGGAMAHASPCYEWSYPFTRFHVFFPMGTAPEALAARTGFSVSGREDEGEFRVRVFSRVA